MTLQEKVMDYCNQNGLKLSYVAKQVELSQTVLSLWLHGKRELDSYYTQQLEERFTK